MGIVRVAFRFLSLGVCLISLLQIGMTGCGNGDKNKITLKGQFVTYLSESAPSQVITPEGCKYTCTTVVIGNSDPENVLLEWVTNHHLSCGPDQTPVNKTTIQIIGDAIFKYKDLLTVSLTCIPDIPTINILNLNYLFNIYTAEASFTSDSCGHPCEMMLSLQSFEASDLCIIINAANITVKELCDPENEEAMIYCLLQGYIEVDLAPEYRCELVDIEIPDDLFGGGDETCGNGEWDFDIEETCDASAPVPDGFSDWDHYCSQQPGGNEDSYCADYCICENPPSQCGNGQIDGGEECDPGLNPGEQIGCSGEEICSRISGGSGPDTVQKCACIDCVGFGCVGGSPDGICDAKEAVCGSCDEDCGSSSACYTGLSWGEAIFRTGGDCSIYDGDCCTTLSYNTFYHDTLTHCCCYESKNNPPIEDEAADGCRDDCDNDGDGLIDCDDSDCADAAECQAGAGCGNGAMDLGEECDDSCIGDPPTCFKCPTTEVCGPPGHPDECQCFDCPTGYASESEAFGGCLDGCDNDGDGYVDCADCDCIGYTDPITQELTCPNQTPRCGDNCWTSWEPYNEECDPYCFYYGHCSDACPGTVDEGWNCGQPNTAEACQCIAP